MEDEPPRWWYFFFVGGFLTYRLLDELDGKQARATANTSPLGMMVDHGCDSIMCMFLCITLVKVFMLGASSFSLFIIQCGTGVFLFMIFEEHYRGFIEFGKISPASDSVWIAVILFVFTGFTGAAWWK